MHRRAPAHWREASPAIEKQRAKRRIKEAKSFGEFGEKWLTAAPMADSTRVVFELIESGGFPNRLGFDSTCWPGMEAGRYGQTLFE